MIQESKMKIIDMIKKTIRKNRFLEELSYIIHNKLLYRWINFSGGGSIDMIAGYDQMAQHCEQIFSRYNNLDTFELNRQTVLEIGPGRTLGVGALFVLNGADMVVSIDRFNCLREEDEEIVKNICEKHNGSYSEICRKIRFMPGTRIEEIGDIFEKGKFDMIVSTAVLEHVGDLEKAFQQMSKVIKPGGIMVHEVDLACHNRFARVHPLAFLTFSDRRWARMGNNVGHPNRFSFSHYLAFLEKFRFQIESYEITKRIGSSKIGEIRDSLDNIFAELSDDDLSILGFRFRARKR